MRLRLQIVLGFLIMISFFSVATNADGGYDYLKHGYKPVPDTYLSNEKGNKQGGNFQYMKWCEETFNNGSHIYEAYKNIAFNIKYIQESNNVDFWQTPKETARLRSGDCEDIAFSFSSQLPPDMKNAEIVWGRISDKQTKFELSHVWYQLTDKKGQKYVVEGGSGDWNGIIPMTIVKNTETRNPTLTISHCMLNKLSRLLPEVEDWKMCQVLSGLLIEVNISMNASRWRPSDMNINLQGHLIDRGYDGQPADTRPRSRQYTRNTNYPPINKKLSSIKKEIYDIFEELRGFFTRQKAEEGEMEKERVW